MNICEVNFSADHYYRILLVMKLQIIIILAIMIITSDIKIQLEWLANTYHKEPYKIGAYYTENECLSTEDIGCEKQPKVSLVKALNLKLAEEKDQDKSSECAKTWNGTHELDLYREWSS